MRPVSLPSDDAALQQYSESERLRDQSRRTRGKAWARAAAAAYNPRP